MTQEELEKMRVKKQDISWQALDYEEYSECQYNDNGEIKVKVYALFPLGTPYVRSYFMQSALETGMFNHGGYNKGHQGADWLSRTTTSLIIRYGREDGHFDGSIAEQIYEYEVRRRTAKKILNMSIDLNTRISRAEDVLLKGKKEDDMYLAAKKEVDAELDEYVVKAPIVSVASGICARANYDCYSGFAVSVIHTTGGTSANTAYVHMRRWPEVQEGDILGPGTIVGYEGTTGNSSGYHLHQGITIGGQADSPAEYMGPIFAPFYNKDKVFETLGIIEDEWNNAPQELILGTEYMDLIRTVLLYPLKEDGSFKDEGAMLRHGGNMTNNTGGNTRYLLDCSFTYYDGKEYINYVGDSGDGIAGYYSGDNKVVIKVGGTTNPEYYECDVKVVSTNKAENLNSGDPKDYMASATNEERLQVLNKRKITFDEAKLSDGIQIKNSMYSYGIAPVIWGNNVPLSPLIEDIRNGVDISILSTQRDFDPTDEKYKREYENEPTEPTKIDDWEHASDDDLRDVTANPILFSVDPDRLKAPDWIITHLTDVDSPFVVPFYDGPLDEEMQNMGLTLGMPGTQSEDVSLLKKALILRGFATRDELGTSGDFSPRLTETLKKVHEAGEPYSAIFGFGIGATGSYLEEANFSNRGVTDWNAVVTYGSIRKAQEVGAQAASSAALQFGFREAFVRSVAWHESNFIPTAESFLFCGPGGTIDFTDPAFPTETDSFDGVIEYKGVKRALRRAIGLMQLSPTTGMSYATSDSDQIAGSNYANTQLGYDDDEPLSTYNIDIDRIIAKIRTPQSNALLGCEVLRDQMNAILGDEGKYAALRSYVDNNDAFTRMSKDSGVNRYEIALMGCAALMYNQGPGYMPGQSETNTDRVIKSLQYITYQNGVVSGSGGICDIGYWVMVMDDVVNNRMHIK